MSEKSMLSTLQQAASNLMEASQEAGPPISVGPAPLNRKAREAQLEYIDTKTARLQKHINDLEAQIQAQVAASDAELVDLRAAQAASQMQIEQHRAKDAQAVAHVKELRESIRELQEDIRKLEAELVSYQSSIENIENQRAITEEAMQDLQKRLAESFAFEKTFASKREPQIEYLRKQQNKYKRRLGGHQMRTAHLKGE